MHGWDIVILKLLMQKSVLEGMETAEKLGQKIVVDVDDWFDGLPESNNASQTTDPVTNPKNNREIYAEIIMRAHAITVSTPFLHEYYSKKRKNVFLVRNGIDINSKRRWSQQRNRNVQGKIAVGWVGATSWRGLDLEQLNPWFSEYLDKNNLNFHHSGHTDNSPNAGKILNIKEGSFRVAPLVPILQYPQIFNHFDIGIVPLNNIPFNHAKSFIKGLEYAAAGIPFICSYSPEYEFLVDSGIGRMARTEAEWIYHLEELMHAKKRVDEKKHNLEALQDFSIQKRGLEWNSVLLEILNQE